MKIFNIYLPVAGIHFNVIILILIGFCGGVIAGFFGEGGGLIFLPTLIHLIGLPAIIVVGTSLITILFSSAYGCFIYALHGRVELYAAFILLIGASIGAQVGSTAVRYVKSYGIKLLFAIMITFAGFSVTLNQFNKLVNNSLFQTLAEITLMGTAVIMTTIIIGKLIIEIKKERRIELKPIK
jgi:uncharacterized membrane protein YfcA